MAGIGFAQSRIAEQGGTGHWNDPDMLVIGHLGWGPSLHPTQLTRNEQMTHITLWAMLAAPLLLGCDLRQLDEFTLALVTNDDVLAIDQDVLGEPCSRIAQSARTEVWARPLWDGTLAVALFNRARSEAVMAVSWKDLHRDGPQPVRDCWRKRDVGVQQDGYRTAVPRHGAVLLRIDQIRD